jgi:hypothetical protein
LISSLNFHGILGSSGRELSLAGIRDSCPHTTQRRMLLVFIFVICGGEGVRRLTSNMKEALPIPYRRTTSTLK